MMVPEHQPKQATSSSKLSYQPSNQPVPERRSTSQSSYNKFTIRAYSETFYHRSGWPSRGGNNGVAVPSVADERNALLNLNCADRDDTSISVFAFEYDDQLWKGNDNERSFGIFGKINLLGDAFAPC